MTKDVSNCFALIVSSLRCGHTLGPRFRIFILCVKDCKIINKNTLGYQCTKVMDLAFKKKTIRKE